MLEAALLFIRIAQFLGTYRGFRQRGEASALLKRHFYYPHSWRRVESESPRKGRLIHYDEIDPPKAV